MMQFARNKPTALNLSSAPIEVGAVIVQDTSGKVLMAERRATQKSAGFWEIPGGKLEQGETPAQAALRELREETGIIADPATLRPFAVHIHMFTTRTVRVHFFIAGDWSGSASGLEGQKVDWVEPQSNGLPILPSNIRALSILTLPMLVQRVTSEADCVGVNAAPLIEIPNLPPAQRSALVRRMTSRRGCGGFWLAGGPAEAATTGATVLLGDVGAPPPVATPARQGLWAVPCANAAEVARANAQGADLVLLCVGQAADGALDWGGFAQTVAGAGLPVWADGNLSKDHLDLAIAAGAAGICTGSSAAR
ncbi:MAG: NUDIX domain-containing protein [Brevirhabdus sp.]